MKDLASQSTRRDLGTNFVSRPSFYRETTDRCGTTAIAITAIDELRFEGCGRGQKRSPIAQLAVSIPLLTERFQVRVLVGELFRYNLMARCHSSKVEMPVRIRLAGRYTINTNSFAIPRVMGTVCSSAYNMSLCAVNTAYSHYLAAFCV